MTKKKLKSFLRVWNKCNKLYKNHYNGNSLPFPEPLQKDIVKNYYDGSLVISKGSPYDFQGNIELKSSTRCGGGCTPFKSTQNACARIIYVEIGTHFDVFEIDPADVQIINGLVSPNGQTSITLSNYKGNAKRTRIV